MATRKMPIHLYWVTTPDHSEDWFILARTRRSAAKFHDIYEGYDDQYATAQLRESRVRNVALRLRFPSSLEREDLCSP
jgi:hypothetical protein